MISVVTRFLFCFTLVATLVSAGDENKYFHEPAEDDLRRHYDSRFFKDIVSDEERQITLTALVRAYLLLFDKFNLETWIGKSISCPNSTKDAKEISSWHVAGMVLERPNTPVGK